MLRAVHVSICCGMKNQKENRMKKERTNGKGLAGGERGAMHCVKNEK